MLEKIDHIGIAVKDMEAALGMYKKVYGLDAIKIETIETANIKIAFLPVGEVLIELLSPVDPAAGRIAEFLNENGEGFHHIAYRVKDIDGAMETLKTIEVPFQDKEPRKGADNSRIAFMEPTFMNNIHTELVERKYEICNSHTKSEG